MQNIIKVFESSEFGKLEVLMIGDKPYFPAAECAKLLGYKDTTNAIKQHCKGVVKHHILTNGGKQRINIITEGDLYRLIIRSKLPSAIRFEKWVMDEVLPAIRKYGAFISDDLLDQLIDNPEAAVKLFAKLKDERAKKGVLEKQIGKLIPKASYYDIVLRCPGLVLVSVIAKEYGMTSVKFNKLLHALGVQFHYTTTKTWMLYSEHENKGYTATNTYHRNGNAYIHMCWTQKGRYWLYEYLKGHGILPKAEMPGQLAKPPVV